MKRVMTLTGLVVLFVAAAASADVVVRKSDGYRFEGEIVREDEDGVRIDTMLSGTRATLSIKRSDVKLVETKPVPPGFFGPPPAAKRVSDPKAFGPDDTLYLEVPIRGKFGQQVLGEGIEAGVRYAERNRIRHIVFVIDSTGWNNIDEAGAVFNTLREVPENIRLHALIKNCTGDALAVAMTCGTITLVPGAKVGGTEGEITKASTKYEAEDEAVVRQQIAHECMLFIQKRGGSGRIIKTMIDPMERLVAWLDKDGRVVYDVEPPEKLPAGGLIFQTKKGEQLVLDYDQTLKLGLPEFSGGAGELGAVLDLKGWRKESAYGANAMNRARVKQRKADTKAAAFESAVKRNISRRKTTAHAMDHNLKKADEYDPKKGQYRTGSGGYGFGWRRRGYWGGGSNRFTRDSREQWKLRTDACMTYLKRAAKAAQAMQRLDKEAIRLGLTPTYNAQELSMWMKDMDSRYRMLRAERDRKGY